MSTFIAASEIARLTGRKRWSAQCRALKAMGIAYRRAGPRGDGEPLVLAIALDAAGKPAQRRGHRWHMIGSVTQIRL